MTRNKWNKCLTEQIPGLLHYAIALTRSNDMAEDLIQDCLERAWNKRSLWNTQRKLRPWLFSIMHNIYINEINKISNKSIHVPIDLSMVDDSVNNFQLLQIRDLENALGKLSPEYREVILLAGLENLSYKEIAKITDLPLGTVMSRLSRARGKLKQFMDGNEADNVVHLR